MFHLRVGTQHADHPKIFEPGRGGRRFVWLARGRSGLGASARGLPRPAPQAIDFSQPFNLDFIKNRLVSYRCTQYGADVAKALAEARDWVAMRASQVSKPAIVLDIDETSLSNWTRIYKNHFAFFWHGSCDLADKLAACGDEAWEGSAQAPALTPTLDLFNFAKCKDRPPHPNCSRTDSNRRDQRGDRKGSRSGRLSRLGRPLFARPEHAGPAGRRF
jgi:hypothetical protein